MLDFKTGLKFAKAYAKAAVMVWTDPPRDFEVKLDRLETELENGRLRLVVRWLDDSPDDKVWRKAELRIDAATYAFDSGRCDWWLLGKEHRGSAEMGLMLITAPAAALLAPLIAFKNRRFASQEKRQGMSRHAIALYEAVKDELEPREREVLHAALQRDRARDVEFGKVPSLKDAREMLSKLHVQQHIFTNDDDVMDEPRRDLIWFDPDGGTVAEASFYKDGSCHARVLSASFDGQDVHALSMCWNTMAMFENGEPRGTATRNQ